MRLALALCLLSGCLIQEPQDDDPYYDYGSGGGNPGSGWGGGNGPPTTYGCQSDSACGTGNVCARTGECLPASQVRVVHTLWTVNGMAASTTTCANAPDLSITFTNSYGEEWGYTPVPCRAGKHTIDKFPTRFNIVWLQRAYDYSGGATGTYDAEGNATLDLKY